VILLLAVLAGLLVGIGWARWRNQPYQAPALKSIWLVFVAFLPQLVVAYLPPTHSLLPDWLAASSLSVSLILFLAFVLLNRMLPGMPILIIGLGLNLIVILANRGWMPISPQTANHLIGNVLKLPSLGSRFGQKDILLLPQVMHFEFLTDRYLLPDWFPYKVAFSLGDILIALGVFWLLAKPAGQAEGQRSKR
jgi:hypothetical protein